MSSPYDAGIKWDQFFCAPGESCDRTLEFRVRSIYIDNLSNSWLYLPDLARYIPPLTLGWQANYNGPTARIRVDASDAPPGGIESSNTGGNVTIAVYSVPKSESFGTTLGSVSNQAQGSQILVNALLIATDGAAHQHIVGVAGKHIVILSWVVAYLIAGGPLVVPVDRYNFRLFSNTGLETTLQDGRLSDQFDLYPYGVELATGTDLTIFANSDGASQPVFKSLVRYYMSDA